MKYNLKELKQVTTRCCRLASDARHTFKNAVVNWADFQCVCAEYYVEDCSGVSYRVYIEEADSNNTEVISFIADELAMRGYKNIEIKLEW